jgi:hypothetical protein
VHLKADVDTNLGVGNIFDLSKSCFLFLLRFGFYSTVG